MFYKELQLTRCSLGQVLLRRHHTFINSSRLIDFAIHVLQISCRSRAARRIVRGLLQREMPEEDRGKGGEVERALTSWNPIVPCFWSYLRMSLTTLGLSLMLELYKS